MAGGEINYDKTAEVIVRDIGTFNSVLLRSTVWKSRSKIDKQAAKGMTRCSLFNLPGSNRYRERGTTDGTN